jgi:hypothetical protein
MKKVKLYTVLTFMFLLPVLADACPLCQAGATKKTQKAYEETTALLALIPILGGGGITYWLYSMVKKNKKDDEQGMAQ